MKRNYKNTAQLATKVIFFLLVSVTAFAQNGVRIAGTAGTADPSAMLDVVSSNKGVLFPRVCLASLTANSSPVTNPQAGLVIYNTGSCGIPATGLYFWNGSSWVFLNTGGFTASGTAGYVARFTASNAIGDGVIQDDGTYVGIGTAPSGSYKLNVQGGSLNVGTLYGTSVMYGTLGTFDTRGTNPNPETYNMGVTSEFKQNSSNGLSDGGTFNEVLTLRNWSSGTDYSGGGVHQLSFTANGNMYHRYSGAAGSWGPWYKLTDSKAIVFNCTGADQTWVCPTGVSSITVKMWGAGGGSGAKGGWTMGFYGGGGGYTTATVAVTAGQTYYIVVGQGGGSGSQPNLTSTYGGGGKSCGGGTDCQYAGAGGGRSAFRNTANTADLVTAGGGGGGGSIVTIASTNTCRGGAGGGATGQTGECIQTASWAGGGGTQSAGGTAGNGGSCVGAAGTQYQGGAMTCGQSYGGGGGGGWWGGGSGSYSASSMGGGGGGSGYIGGAGVSGGSYAQGSFQQPAGANDPNYLPGVGFGGMGGGGGNGLVVIIIPN